MHSALHIQSVKCVVLMAIFAIVVVYLGLLVKKQDEVCYVFNGELICANCSDTQIYKTKLK